MSRHICSRLFLLTNLCTFPPLLLRFLVYDICTYLLGLMTNLLQQKKLLQLFNYSVYYLQRCSNFLSYLLIHGSSLNQHSEKLPSPHFSSLLIKLFPCKMTSSSSSRWVLGPVPTCPIEENSAFSHIPILCVQR